MASSSSAARAAPGSSDSLPLSFAELATVRLPAVLPELTGYAALQVACFVVFFAFAKWGWPNHKDTVGLADTFLSLLIFPVMTGAAIVASYELRETVDTRWAARTASSDFFLVLFVTRTFLHMPIQCIMKMQRRQFWLMTIHHIVSFICFLSGLLTQRMGFFACFDGVCEMSTIFLTNLFLFKEVTIRGKELKEVVPRWIYAANGCALWLTFFVFRLILFPIWLYVWYTDITAHPAKTWDLSNPLERYMYPTTNVLLLGLSTFWFIPLTKGAIKALRSPDDKKSEEKAN
mmetsp:Transcript_41616/g.120683  ORF Transcript_41616/g.120683 Transcript_41616/m.120683 type:complete len:289 (+) Transcript_41616:73-939(+)